MQPGYKFLVLGLSAALLANCTIVESERLTIQSTEPLEEGLVYFLPKKRLKFIAERKPLVEEAVRKEFKSANDQLAAAQKALSAAKAVAAAAKALAEANATDDNKKKQKDAEAKQGIVQGRVDKLLISLEQALQKLLSLSDGTCPATFDFKFALLAAEPDPAQVFRANLTHNPFRDDKLDISVNAAGLLSTAKAEATDRTGDIIVELAGAVAGFISPTSVGLIPLFRIDDESSEKPCPPKIKIEKIYDPTNADAATVFTDSISIQTALGVPYFPSFRVTIVGPSATDKPAIPSLQTADPASFTGSVPGLIYRQPLGYVVSVEQGEGETIRSASILSAIFMLPNRGPVSYIPFRTSAFVKTIAEVEFKDGSISKWHTDRPSELLELVRLPVKIMKSIISVPAELIKLRVDYSSQSQSLLAAQQAQIAAAEKLSLLQQCIELAGDDADKVTTCISN